MAVLLFFAMHLQAQDTLTEYKGLMLSSVLVADINNGFDVDKFIQRVQYDSTFYKAFKSLSLVSLTQYNDIVFLDKNDEPEAFYNSISIQKRRDNCRSIKNQNETFSKNYYKKNSRTPRYTTADFYHKLFLFEDTICNEDNIVNGQLSASENRRVNQLKKLVFKPGESISGVPGIGGKVGIFEEGRKEQYNFSLEKELYNGAWCYVFRARPKDRYHNRNVINYLDTWFRVKDQAIVKRNYSLSYKTLFYDFDVEMKVKLKAFQNLLLPYEILFDGNWHVATQDRERCRFSVLLTDFE